jgi:hypothetical protein
MSVQPIRVPTAGLLTLLAACSPDPAANNAETHSDSAGIHIVSHEGLDRVLPWTFAPVWSLGGASDDRLPLSELGAHHLSVGTGGHLAVLDEAGHRVLMFSSDGQWLRTIGREGGGPGELVSPAAVATDHEGIITVYDVGKQALVSWSADGVARAETRMNAPFWGPRLRAGSGGSVLFNSLSAGNGGTSEQWLVEWTPAAERRLVRFQRMSDSNADFSICGFAALPIAPLFAPELNWDAMGSRVAFNTDVAYRIDVLDAAGPALSIRRDVPVREVTQAMAYAEAGAGLAIPVADCTVPPAVLVREQGYAAVVPGITDLVISPAGELWVRRGTVIGEPERADVFSRDGVYLGTLPPGTPFPAAFLPDGRLISLQPDSFDAPRIVAYDVERSQE